jgi:hypothetical protein
MKYRNSSKTTALLTLVVLAAVSSGVLAQQTIKTPEPGVPELFTIKGQWVRIAYNNEGYVSLAYRIANQDVGKEWLLLEIGTTLRQGVDNYTLKREHLTVDTPDGKTIPLATLTEYRKAGLQALERRAGVVRDSINYFPPGATELSRIGFFAQLGSQLKAWDQVELSTRRANLARVFFQVPGGIKYGQHWLNVQFEKSVVRVPFRILTEEEEEQFSDTWQDVKKEHEKRFKK